MSSVERFAVQFSNIAQCPERFRDPLGEAVNPREEICDIIYSPAFAPSRAFSLPASVLCVTNQQWIVAHETDEGVIAVDKATFADTLLVELTVILLYGQLKIDYAKAEKSESSACFFNTVIEDTYKKAIHHILDLIDGKRTGSWTKDGEIMGALKMWPIKFRNLGLLNVPPGSKLLGQLYWPTIVGGFRRELAPAAALFLTDRHLIVAAEERSSSWFRKKDDTKYGAIITYFPRSRISGFQIQEHRRFHILELEAEGLAGAEEFQVLFPPENDQEIAKLLSQVARGAASAPSLI